MASSAPFHSLVGSAYLAMGKGVRLAAGRLCGEVMWGSGVLLMVFELSRWRSDFYGS